MRVVFVASPFSLHSTLFTPLSLVRLPLGLGIQIKRLSVSAFNCVFVIANCLAWYRLRTGTHTHTSTHLCFICLCMCCCFLHAASDKAPFVLSYLLLLLSPALPLFRLTLRLPSVLLFSIFAKFVKTKKKILGRKKVYKKPVLFCYLCDCVCVCMWVSFPCVCVCVCAG